MATILSFLSGQQITDENGDVVEDAQLFHYQATTTNDLTVYSNQAGSAPHSQPVDCDAGGFVPLIYVGDSSDWKVVIKDGTGATLRTYDNLPKAVAEISAANFAPPLFEWTQVNSAASPVALTAANAGKAYECDTGSGNIEFDLPSAASVGNGKGFVFKKTSASNSLIIDPNSTETIDDIAISRSISAKDTCIAIYSNGAEWYVTSINTRVNIQTFTGSGTYTPTPGMAYCRARLQAPGGGSGGADGAGDTTSGVGSGGGGGGEYAEGYFTASQIGTSQVVTIGAVGTAGTAAGGNGGAGGTTSLGSLITAIGGGGGSGSGSDTTSGLPRAGGAGGTGGTGGHLRIPGGNGGFSFSRINDITDTSLPGIGGGSHLAPTRGTLNVLEVDTAGIAGADYGGGASGAWDDDNTGSAGAAGGASIMIIEEFLA